VGIFIFKGLAEIESIATLNIDIRHPISLLSRVGNFRGANENSRLLIYEWSKLSDRTTTPHVNIRHIDILSASLSPRAPHTQPL
jgi:hypothetical protein